MRKPNPQVQSALAERWPHLFSFPVPLKVGIHKDLPPVGERPVSIKKFSKFLFLWVQQPEYIEALKTAKHRYGMNGEMYPFDESQRPNGRGLAP